MQIQGAIFKYKKGALDDEFVKKIEVDSKKQISQMSETIDNFRNFFKPEKEKVEFDVAKAVKDSIKLIYPALKSENITLKLDVDEEIYMTSFPHELGQALINILNNAKDAFAQHEEQNQKVISISLHVDEKIHLQIKDNAGGIPKEILKDIFAPYFSTKDDKNGTGLGLYMSKIIIEEHMGGKIMATNVEDGALFEILFKAEA
jgi:signal transduction histidine kinase